MALQVLDILLFIKNCYQKYTLTTFACRIAPAGIATVDPPATIPLIIFSVEIIFSFYNLLHTSCRSSIWY